MVITITISRIFATLTKTTISNNHHKTSKPIDKTTQPSTILPETVVAQTIIDATNNNIISKTISLSLISFIYT